MKGTDVFDSMNSLPADMVTAAELPADELAAAGYGISEKQKRRENRALIFSSGWFAAAVSVVVALTVVVLIVAAGRNGGAAGKRPAGNNPSGHSSGVLPESQLLREGDAFPRESDWAECNDFAFRYKILNEGEFIRPGDTVTIEAFVKNLGPDFTYTGGSGDFCPQNVVLIGSGPAGSTSWHVVYDMLYALPADEGTFTVRTGDVGHNVYTFTLPKDCLCGYYQLSMQYGNGSVGWSCAVNVSRSLTFTYSFTENPVSFVTNHDYQVSFDIRENGEPFSIRTDDFPKAWIVHHTMRNIVNLTECDLSKNGNANGAVTGCRYHGYLKLSRVTIPAGSYDLVITWQGCTSVWENAMYITAQQEAASGGYAFSWNADKTIAERGGMLQMILKLEGTPQDGNTDAFRPEAVLKLDDDHILTVPAPENGDFSQYTPADGIGTRSIVRVGIPYDALPGSYDLVLTYGGETVVFEDAVQIVRDEDAVQGGTLEGDSPEVFGPREPGYDDEFTSGTPGLVYGYYEHDPRLKVMSAGSAEGCAEIRIPSYSEEYGDYVMIIETGAFAHNRNLQTLYIPKGVNVIGRGAFADTRLTAIYYQGYADDWEFYIGACPGWNDGLDYVTVVCRDRTFVVPPTGGENQNVLPPLYSDETAPGYETEIFRD